MSECKHPLERRDAVEAFGSIVWICRSCGKGGMPSPISELAQRIADLERAMEEMVIKVAKIPGPDGLL